MRVRRGEEDVSPSLSQVAQEQAHTRCGHVSGAFDSAGTWVSKMPPFANAEKAVLLQALSSTDQERNSHGTSRIHLLALCFPEAWHVEGLLDQRLLLTAAGPRDPLRVWWWKA